MGHVGTIPTYENWEAGIDDSGHGEYTCTYQVFFDTHTDGPDAACLAPGVPAWRSTYNHLGNVNPYAFCTTVKAKPKAAVNAKNVKLTGANVKLFYEVTATFSTNVTQFENPLDQPMRISGNFSNFTRPLIFDTNTFKAVTNSAYCPFENDIEVDDSRAILKVSRNEPHPFNFPLACFYRNKINNDFWNGFSAGCVKCTNINYDGPIKAQVGGYPIWYWDVSYDFDINFDSWTVYVLDAGFQEIDEDEESGDIMLKHILDEKMQPVATPQLLDGYGRPFEDPQSATPVFLPYNGYYAVDFSGFNIDLNAPLTF